MLSAFLYLTKEHAGPPSRPLLLFYMVIFLCYNWIVTLLGSLSDFTELTTITIDVKLGRKFYSKPFKNVR